MSRFRLTAERPSALSARTAPAKAPSYRSSPAFWRPTAGNAAVTGRVAALLELGSGFNPEFTGRENVYLNASILGLTQTQIDQRYQDIAAFAEIGDFIDQPVKTYSSGMTVRLAFAVAIHVDPEILLVDEALAVGDIYFRQRCMRKVHELRAAGVTILFVSHSMGDVKAIGDRCMWLDSGHVRELGPADQVIAKYLAAMAEKDSDYLGSPQAVAHFTTSSTAGPPEIIERIPNVDHRHGDGRAEIIGITVYDAFGRETPILSPGTRVSSFGFQRKQTAMSRCRTSASCCEIISASISPERTQHEKGISFLR